MEKRTLLAIVLSVAVVFLYQIFFAPKPAPQYAENDQAAVTQDSAPIETTVAAAPSAMKPEPGKAVLTTAGTESEVEKEIIVETTLYRAVFTNRGGTLRSFQLKNFRTSLEEEAGLIELVSLMPHMPLPLSHSFVDSSILVPRGDFYEADRSSINLSADDTSAALTFQRTYPGMIRIEKTYTFRYDQYAIQLDTRVINLSPSTLQQNATLAWFHHDDPSEEKDSWSHDGPIFYKNKSVEVIKLKDLKAEEHHSPDISWAGYESKYFISAIIPRNPALTSLTLERDDRNTVSVQLKGPKTVIPANQDGLFSYTLYLGPKDYAIMKALNVGLENAIDFGSWIKWLTMPLLLVLKFIFNYVHNYGIAIIILTILIKIIFWPLGNKSYKSMKEMQKLQPKILELREKYKDDKAKLSQETMALYKTHKVNPLGGCLPILIQIPVFFGLYKVLLYAIELRHSPFFFWIQDLSAKDPYYITPIVMGATMFIQQKMTPTMGDPMQAKIMLFMPVIFTFLFLNFPSGLVLYWLFNNIISIGQQYYINKRA